MRKRQFVTVKYRIPGFHKWPGANNYLKFLHRHEFHFTVRIEVKHGNRDIEFIDLKEKLFRFTGKCMLYLDQSFSCETLSEEIGKYISSIYPNQPFAVWVEEDGENGAYLEAK